MKGGRVPPGEADGDRTPKSSHQKSRGRTPTKRGPGPARGPDTGERPGKLSDTGLTLI